MTPSAARLASGDAVPSDGEVLRPIRRGVVHDWDALEAVYHHIFYEQARPPAARARAALADVRAPSLSAAGVGDGGGGLRAGCGAAADVQGACDARRVAPPALTARGPRAQASREQLAHLLFEQFNVAGFYVTEAPVLSLYAAGKLTGTAVDVGAEKIGAAAARSAFLGFGVLRLTPRRAQTSARCTRAC